ncbi:hypothetical protein [Schumannella soli]|uniref:DUF3137 domain-containing protein n=1 Tax=Schumannella soli TaxID=2590779 RepID=A0A506XTQ9_9MICO|nr:hypothetical protein [Schumannella soli]TPW76091.1 hypothetical protein FJ657_09740 [Schumannella soli]
MLAPRPGEKLTPLLQGPLRTRASTSTFFLALVPAVTFVVVGLPKAVILLSADPARPVGAVALIAVTAILVVVSALDFRASNRSVRAQSALRARITDRLPEFAERNGMSYLATDPGLWLPHPMFHRRGVENARFEGVLRPPSPRDVVAGTYRAESGQGRERTTIARPLVAIRLDRPLPHIRLESRSGAPFDDRTPGQSLSLEGDFDRWFRLYCPRGAEVEALTVLTPDVMAALIDEIPHWRVEIVDDQLLLVPWFFTFDALDGEGLRAVFRVIERVGQQFTEQTDGPRRTELPPERVRRLRAADRPWPLVAIGLLGGILAMMAAILAIQLWLPL